MKGLRNNPSVCCHSVISLVLIITMVSLTHPASATPLKLETEALDIVDIVTSIENQEVEDTLGLNNNSVRLDAISDEDPAAIEDITTEGGPPPVADSLIIAGNSASIRDEDGLIFEFPNRCPEGHKQDPSGQCRKPFAPNGGLL